MLLPLASLTTLHWLPPVVVFASFDPWAETVSVLSAHLSQTPFAICLTTVHFSLLMLKSLRGGYDEGITA